MTSPERETGRAHALVDHVSAIFTSLGGHTAIAATRIPSTSSSGQPPPMTSSNDSGAQGDGDNRDRPGGASELAAAPKDDNELLVHADDVFPAASLAKLPIAMELFRRTDLGQFDLDERFDTSAEPRVGGGGVLDHLDPATQLTLRDLCYLMLGVSDNTAANFVLDLVGMGEVNETASRINLAHTRLARRFMDWGARAARRENVTCAADMHALLRLIRSNALPGARLLYDMLASQQLGEDLVLRLPESASLAHKTGTLEDVFHDAGILSGPSGTCVYCVLTADQTVLTAARAAVADVLLALWEAWCAG